MTDLTELGRNRALSSELLALEVERRGYEPRWIRRSLFVAEMDGTVQGFNLTRCNITSTIAREITSSKRLTRRVLRDAGLSIADGRIYTSDQLDKALADIDAWPVVIKPLSSRASKGVTIGIRTEDEFRQAWKTARAGRLIVEQQFTGQEARLFTVGGVGIAACGHRRPNVTGDGTSTIAELAAAKQAERDLNPHLRGKQLRLTDARLAYLRDRDLTANSIPDAGETVWLEDVGGIAGRPTIWREGADSVDLTDTVHPSYLEIAGRAEKAIPGLGLCGVDMIAADWTQPATPDNHIIVEVNSRPVLGCHHFPWEGKSRDVAAAIVDQCLASAALQR